jgi:hypothetical protein
MLCSFTLLSQHTGLWQNMFFHQNGIARTVMQWRQAYAMGSPAMIAPGLLSASLHGTYSNEMN